MRKYTPQDIHLGTGIPYATVDRTIIAFNSALVRNVVKDGDYQTAILEIAAYLNEDPGEFFLKLDEKLQSTIRSRVRNGS